MGITMSLGQSDQQAQSARAILGTRLTAYQSLQTSLNQLILNSPSLSGQTYDSAKAYSQQILMPLLKGAILVDEAIQSACAKLPSEYRSQVDSGDLKEDELVEKIIRADRLIGRYMDLISLEYRKDKPNYLHISNLRSLENTHRELKQELEEKLRKLRAFDMSSVHLFSHIQPLIDAVQSGLNQASTSWNADTKVFTLPPSREMTWVETVEKGWEKSSAYIDELISKSEHGFGLSSTELNDLARYLVENPQSRIYDKGLSVFLKSLKVGNVVIDDITSLLRDTYGGNLKEFSDNIISESVDELRDNAAEKLLLELARIAPSIANVASTRLSKASIIGALVVMLSSAPNGLKNITYNVIEKVGGSSVVASSKLGGAFGSLSSPTSGVITKLGFETNASLGLGILSAGVDAWSQIGEGENVVNATVKGTAHTVMATTIIGQTTAYGAALGTAIPIPGVGTAIGAAAGLAVGVAISMGADAIFDKIYDNSIGKIVNWAMDNEVGRNINTVATNFVTNVNKEIDNVVSPIISSTKEFFDDVGDAVGGWMTNLGSVFN